MLAKGDHRGVVDRAAVFTTKCGDHPPLHELTYVAHQRLGELDQAAADLSALIEHSPQMPYYDAWRASIYEEKRDFDRAADDLRQALARSPAAVDIPQRLADIYERQGKDCDAVVLLQQLAFRYEREAFAAGVRSRAEGLERKGACAAGASFVAIPRKTSERLGLDLANAPTGKLATANGVREAQLVVLPSVSVGALKAERVTAVVVDDLPGIDGLLGMSFLSRFEMRQAGGVIELSARKAPAAVAGAPRP
jgi:clan AA aspartic protease (TIGR02281 family)